MSEFDPKALGNRIKEERLRKGLTQQQLADKLNVARCTLANWETGNHQIPMDKLYKLADALEIDTQISLSPKEPAKKLDDNSPIFILGKDLWPRDVWDNNIIKEITKNKAERSIPNMLFSENKKDATKILNDYSPALTSYVGEALEGKSKVSIDVELADATRIGWKFFLNDVEVNDDEVVLMGESEADQFKWEKSKFELKQGNSAPCKFELDEIGKENSYITLIFDKSLAKN